MPRNKMTEDAKDYPYPSPNNAWQVHLNLVKEVDEFLQGLEINPAHNALWYFLHNVIWHEGIDPVRWINENKNLVKEIAKHEYMSKAPDELIYEAKKSISRMKSGK